MKFLLKSYPFVDTKDIYDARKKQASVWGPYKSRVIGKKKYHLVHNRANLRRSSLGYLTCTSGIHAESRIPQERYWLILPLKGHVEVEINGNGFTGDTTRAVLQAPWEDLKFRSTPTTQTFFYGIDMSLIHKSLPEGFRGMNILTPTVHEETIFTSAHSGHSQLWKHTDQSTSLEEIWSGKSQAYMSSPVVVANHIYLHLRNQRIVCINLETGEEAWRTTPFGKYQSMAVLDDKILALDESGELLLFSANPNEFDLIDRRRVAENDTWGHIAVSKNQIFIRRLDGLAVYTWK